MNISIFEIFMLICFGLSWPLNIYKSLKSKSTKGKSLPFLIAILSGYIFGIVHKLIYSLDIVLFLYMLNATMVSIDISLYFHYKKKSSIPEFFML